MARSGAQAFFVPGDDWHPLDGIPAPEYVPDEWNGVHVATRLADTFSTLALMPDRGGSGPTGFWPATYNDPDDEDEPVSESADAAYIVKEVQSARAIACVEAALGWVGRYLGSHSELARIVNRIAYYRSLGKEIDYAANKIKAPNGGRYLHHHLRALHLRGLDEIAAGLRCDRVPVF